MTKKNGRGIKLKTIKMDPVRVEGKYYRGRIARFNPKTGYGFVETFQGNHIFFYFDQIRFVGAQAKRSDLKAGKVVGFDVGWTDRGIRVCKMKLVGEKGN